jgi:hypothetical protein
VRLRASRISYMVLYQSGERRHLPCPCAPRKPSSVSPTSRAQCLLLACSRRLPILVNGRQIGKEAITYRWQRELGRLERQRRSGCTASPRE